MHISPIGFPNMDRALSSGWLEAMTAGLEPPGGNIIGHDVWACLAKHYTQHNRLAEAEAVLLRGLAAGFPETRAYDTPFSQYFTRDNLARNMWHAPQKRPNVVKAVTLMASALRYIPKVAVCQH